MSKPPTTAALVSLFESGMTKEPEKAISLASFVHGVRDGSWRNQIDPLRTFIARGNRKAYDGTKKRLPAVSLSCHCLSREKDLTHEQKAVTHSGWLQGDFDLKDNMQLAEPGAVVAMRSALIADPHVGAVFVGPSGEGIKAVVAIDPLNHAGSWAAAEVHFRKTYGLKMDSSTKDPMRLCFVSYDPDATVSDAVKTLDVPIATSAALVTGPSDKEKKNYSPNDAGRAERFVDLFSNDIRFIPELGIWMTWAGGRWEIDKTGALTRLALKLSQEMLDEVNEIRAKAIARKATEEEMKMIASLFKEPLLCGERNNIHDFLELAKVDPRILLSASALDNNPWIAAAPNGIVDLVSGECREFSREDYTTRQLGVKLTQVQLA